MAGQRKIIGFRKIRGRVIPVFQKAELAKQAVITASAVASQAIPKPKTSIKPNQLLRAAGFAASVTSGVLAGATFFTRSRRAFFLGGAASLALDLGSGALIGAAWAGKGDLKERAKGFARDEGKSIIAGNSVFAAGLLGSSRGRKKLGLYGGKIARFVRRAF